MSMVRPDRSAKQAADPNWFMSWGIKLMMADTDRKLELLKRLLIAAILQSIKGFSVRQGESIAGIQAATISRLRRGVDRDYSLEVLIRAAINLGVPVDIHVGEPLMRAPPPDGREGTRRPKERIKKATLG
jgi:transcriptional regulator with XRE-family HTH domain